MSGQPGERPEVEQPEVEQVEIEVPPATAPVLPLEVVLHNSVNWFQRLVGGGMQVKFAPLVQTPAGYVPTTPGYVVEFSADAWERFKREVAADGVKAPAIETVRHFPGDPLNGAGPRG